MKIHPSRTHRVGPTDDGIICLHGWQSVTPEPCSILSSYVGSVWGLFCLVSSAGQRDSGKQQQLQRCANVQLLLYSNTEVTHFLREMSSKSPLPKQHCFHPSLQYTHTHTHTHTHYSTQSIERIKKKTRGLSNLFIFINTQTHKSSVLMDLF